MSEIDVSKCEHYKKSGKCRVPHYRDGILYRNVYCNYDFFNCYYKQLQKVKVENEEIRKINDTNAKLMVKLRDCLDEIEEIIKDSLDACYTCNSSNSCINCDKGNILKKIKQAKEGGE